MAIKPIITAPHPVLRRKANRVPALDALVVRLVQDMIETLQSAEGVGLAAPQIGVSLRIIVIQIPEEQPFAIINPEVVRRCGEREVVEGCLSIPGYQGRVKRAETVTVKGLDERGRALRIKGDELLAQALEHEIDHLNGILYIDLLESPDKLEKIGQPVTALEPANDDR